MKAVAPLIFEISRPGRTGASLPEADVPPVDVRKIFPEGMIRKTPPRLPEVAEVDVVRHYTRLSRLNYGVDTSIYPLGSCTMKYNPKINEDVSALEGFALCHPFELDENVQGSLELAYELSRYLEEILGMDAVSLQPAAGAHGELTGLMIARAYFRARGEERRRKVVVPDSSHGTNPASASMCGYELVTIPSDSRGGVDMEALKKHVDEETAVFMLTNPNTLGLFDENIKEIVEHVHSKGALLYYDGANLNAIMGVSRPGDAGFDIVHVNLHKTFSTPHGGGGPGAGPVGVKKALEPFLPVPVIVRDKDGYRRVWDRPQSIGKVSTHSGNFGVAIKAFAYIIALGRKGLKQVALDAVMNANYLMKKLAGEYRVAYDRRCMHEFVLTGVPFRAHGIRTLDIAKRLLDYGFHAPTIYFPLIVEEAMMIEPTETESRESLDLFAEAMLSIAREIKENPELLHRAPLTTPVSRLDEVAAARNPDLKYSFGEKAERESSTKAARKE